MTIINLLSQGGAVIWPLLGLSILAMVLILERIVFWSKVITWQDQVVQDVLLLYKRDPRAAFLKLKNSADFPLTRIFLAALEHNQLSPEEFRLALETAAQEELPLLRRFQTIFETVTNVAPLLGLLGTILGLIDAFSSLNLSTIGGNQTVGVSRGISEALISTAMGLIVAIFTLLFANLFHNFYRHQLALIQKYGGQLELFYRRHNEPRRKLDAPA